MNHAVALISQRKYLPAMKSLQGALKLRPQDKQTRSTQSMQLCNYAFMYVFIVNGHLEIEDLCIFWQCMCLQVQADQCPKVRL